MPRHRRQPVPWHRALRQAAKPARRARVTHVANTSVAVLEASRPDDPESADTAPLSPQTTGRPRSALRAAARGLMMTPWFAAASGFVIAASLWIYAPHAHLQFNSPGNAIQTQPCHDSCAGGGSHRGHGSLASSGKHRLADRRSGAAVSGLTFSYVPLVSQDGKFTIRISVTGKRAIKNWTLAFVLPGDRIRWVWGASWQRTSRDSGTASPGDGQAGNWPGGGQAGNGPFGGNHQQYGFTFLVSGTGRQVRPTSCRYDGKSCAFRLGREGHPGTD